MIKGCSNPMVVTFGAALPGLKVMLALASTEGRLSERGESAYRAGDGTQSGAMFCSIIVIKELLEYRVTGR